MIDSRCFFPLVSRSAVVKILFRLLYLFIFTSSAVVKKTSILERTWPWQKLQKKDLSSQRSPGTLKLKRKNGESAKT